MTKTHRMVVGIVAAVVVILGAVSVFSYGVFIKHWDGKFVRGVSAATHFPVARVGSHFVRYTDYLKHLDAERIFLKGDTAKSQGFPSEPDIDLKKGILERVIRNAAVEDFANERKVEVTSADMDQAFNALTAQTGASSTTDELRNFIKNEFGWDEDQFKQSMLLPALREDGLKQKQTKDNPSGTPFADELSARLLKPDVVKYLRF